MSLFPTIRLLRMIGTPFEPGRVWEEPEESGELYKYAFKIESVCFTSSPSRRKENSMT